jgi:hypothetical protein
MPPFHASPSKAEGSRSSAGPPSCFPPKESTRGAMVRCRCRRSPRWSRGPPPPISSPAVLLRRSQPRQRLPGELPVRSGPSPASFVPPSPPVRLAGAGRRRPMRVCGRDRPNTQGQRGHPREQPRGNKFLHVYFKSRNFRKCPNVVKFIEYSYCIRKLCIIYQNAQNNVLDMFMSNACMINHLNPD